jgi:DNA ligase-associated metallophosphoesterase
MDAPVLHKKNDQNLWLSGLRSIFWEEQKTLIVSDVHFGKTGHFRKSGIAVPQAVFREDLQRMITLLHYFNPRQLIVVGDFFHSHANLELDLFKKWRNDFSSLDVILVKGNHDILKESWYQEVAIEVHHKDLMIGDFLFSHEHCESDKAKYLFCGHIHPGILINGLGKQSLRFPCFYFAEDHCILPAFSKFTGSVNMGYTEKENIYAIVENSVLKIR